MKKQIVAIIGMGMMGGSIGLAVRARKLPYTVIGIGRNLQKLKKVKKLHAADEVTTDFSQGLKDADLVVICTPVFQIVPMVKKIAPFLKEGSVITDIGSVKGAIVSGVQELLTAYRLPLTTAFVGSHPLCGSEKTGVENSSPNLYQGATVVICPALVPPLYKGRFGGVESVSAVKKFWKSIGAKTLFLEPEIHDILVAQTSHLPHILASAFVTLLAHLSHKDSNAKKLLAGSFKDFTRIVDSDSTQWAEIVSANKKFIIGAIKSYRDILQRLLTKMENSHDPYNELETFFSSAKSSRQKLWEKQGK